MTAVRIDTITDLKREASRDGGLNGFVDRSGARFSRLLSRHATNDSWAILDEDTGVERIHESTKAMLAAEQMIALALDEGRLFAHWIDPDAELPDDLVL